MSVVYDKTNGKIISSGNKKLNTNQIEKIEEEGMGYDNSVGVVSPDHYYYDVINKSLIEKPVKPNTSCYFDYDEKIWNVDEKLIMRDVVNKRNNLLQQSDWTQLDDIPTTTKNKWKQYRQQLRDITSQEGFPFDVVFPDPPE